MHNDEELARRKASCVKKFQIRPILLLKNDKRFFPFTISHYFTTRVTRRKVNRLGESPRIVSPLRAFIVQVGLKELDTEAISD